VHRAQLALEPLEPSTEHVRKRDPERRIGLAARDVEGRYIDLVAPSQSDRPHKKNQRNEGSHRGTRDDDGFEDGHRDDRIPRFGLRNEDRRLPFTSKLVSDVTRN
jgi:hypothetical protein